MASTYTLISSQVLGSSAASVTFSSIPSTYKDLVLRWSVRLQTDGTSTDYPFRISLNTYNSGSTLFSYTLLRGFGSGSGSSSRSSNFNRVDNNDTSAELSTANTFGSGEFYIPSYASSQYKPFSAFSVQENNTTAAEMDVIAALYSSTSAVTSIALFNASTFTFNAGSSFYLYGI